LEWIYIYLAGWLEKHHPAAITDLSGGGYDNLKIWWSGVEATDNEWCFAEEYTEKKNLKN